MQYFTENFNPREYDGMTDLSGNERVTLMCHNKTKKLIIRKEIDKINRDLYKQLIHLKHENLVQIIGVEETETGFYTYEEYINGKTLAEILTDGSIPERKALDWIRQLCAAVRLLHEQKPLIIHRDIKPGNIMLTTDGVIKLIDFDAAKMFTSNKQQDTELIGTPNYAAPEQYGFAPSNPRTDIYAIGILFHELITGNKPNESQTPYKGRYKYIIQTCTELDPKKRYQSVRELECQLGLRGIKRFTRHIPGFRTGIWWKKIIAFIVYTVWAIFVTTVVYENTSLFLLGCLLTLTVPPYILITNPLRIRERLPLIKSKAIMLKILGVMLYISAWLFLSIVVCGIYADLETIQTSQPEESPVSTVEEARQRLQDWLDVNLFDEPVAINDNLTMEDNIGFMFVLYTDKEFARIRVVKRNGGLLWSRPEGYFISIDDWYRRITDKEPINPFLLVN